MSLQWEDKFEQIGQSNCVRIKLVGSQVQYCAKIYNKKRDKLTEKNIKQMLIVCRKLIEQNQFDNIVKIVDIKENSNQVFVFMEYCESNLEKELQNIISEEEIINCIQQILNGFQTLYKLSIQHRNIQAKKILIKKVEGKNLYLITDFFLSKEYEDMQYAHNMTNQGIDEYKAPELLCDLPASGECDIYSFGILFHKLCYNGKLPHMYDDYEKSKEKFIERIKRLDKEEFKASEMPYKNAATLKDLLEQMIKYDAKKRISFKDLFNHSIINVNKDNVYYKFFVYIRVLQTKYQFCQSVINEIKTKGLEWENYILQQCVYLIGRSYLLSAKAILDYNFEDVDEQQLKILGIEKPEKFAKTLQKYLSVEQKQFVNEIYQNYDENEEQMNKLRYFVKDNITNSASEFDYQKFFFRPSMMIETLQMHQNRLLNITKQFDDYIKKHALKEHIEKVLNLEIKFNPQEYLSIRLEQIK